MKRALLLLVLLSGAGISARQLALSEISVGQQGGTNRVEGWPQFRGPGSTGVGEGANLPDTWSTTQNVTWKTAIPGSCWSSPIVYGDYFYTLFDRGFFTCHDARTGNSLLIRTATTLYRISN